MPILWREGGGANLQTQQKNQLNSYLRTSSSHDGNTLFWTWAKLIQNKLVKQSLKLFFNSNIKQFKYLALNIFK